MSDYIGTVSKGMVVNGVPVENAKTAIHKDHGMVSGNNSDNWRYIKSRHTVLWNTSPNDNNEELVDEFLRKRGIVGAKHKVMYKYYENIKYKDFYINEILNGYKLLTLTQFSNLCKREFEKTFPDSNVLIHKEIDYLKNIQLGYKHIYYRTDIILKYTFSKSYKIIIDLIFNKVPNSEVDYNNQDDLEFLAHIPPKSPELHDIISGKNSLLKLSVSVKNIEENIQIFPKVNDSDSFKDAINNLSYSCVNLTELLKIVKKVIDDDNRFDNGSGGKTPPDISPIDPFGIKTPVSYKDLVMTESYNKSIYRGNCVSILKTSEIFSDATEMAYAIESSTPITYDIFNSNISLQNIPRLLSLNLRKHPDHFIYSKYKDLYIAYDKNRDIHYFFL